MLRETVEHNRSEQQLLALLGIAASVSVASVSPINMTASLSTMLCLNGRVVTNTSGTTALSRNNLSGREYH